MIMRHSWWVLWDSAVAIVLVVAMVQLWRLRADVWMLIAAGACALAIVAHVYSASRYWRRWRGVREEQERRADQVVYTDADGNPEMPCGPRRFDAATSRYCHLRCGHGRARLLAGTVTRLEDRSEDHMTFVRPAPTLEHIKSEWLGRGATGPHPSPRGLADETAFAWPEWQDDGHA